MIHMNQQEDVLIYPRKNISHNLKNIIKRKKQIFILILKVSYHLMKNKFIYK